LKLDGDESCAARVPTMSAQKASNTKILLLNLYLLFFCSRPYSRARKKS
jgi:hypothetical protein